MITKSKLRTVAHLIGLLIVGAAVAWVWLTEAVNLPLSVRLGATGVLATTLFTKLDEVIMPRILKVIDSTSLPETETTITTTTIVKTNAAAVPVVDDSQLADTGVHGKGDLP